MILFVSASSRAADCAKAIEKAVRQTSAVCASAAEAAALSRSGEYEIVIFDQATLGNDPSDAAVILRNAEVAFPVYVNSALMNTPRIVSEVCAAIQRVQNERQAAMREAQALLRNEMKGEITGILLSAELLLSTPGIPPLAAEKARDIQQLATRLRQYFEPAL